MFYDNATMFEATKNSIVDTTIIKVAQFKILYIFCSPITGGATRMNCIVVSH